MLSKEVIQDNQQFSNLREEWTELLHDSEIDCIFLTWEWLFTWWQYLGEDRKLLIIAVRKNGQLIGLAPLAIRPSRWKRLLPFKAVEFLGTGNAGSDYLDLILRKSFEQEAMREIAAELDQRRLTVQLSNVREDTSFISYLVNQLTNQGWMISSIPVDRCPFIDLRDKDWDSFVANLGKSHRYNLRRRLRKLREYFHVEMDLVEENVQRCAALKTLVDLHLHRWSGRGGSSAFHTKKLIGFHEKFTGLALERGWLRLYILRLNGKPAAGFYCMNYKDKYYYYQAGFDQNYSSYSVGLAGIALLVNKAIEEGAAEFDFLHGAEMYKYLWTSRDRKVQRLDLFLPYMRGKVYMQGMFLRREIKRTFDFYQRIILGD